MKMKILKKQMALNNLKNVPQFKIKSMRFSIIMLSIGLCFLNFCLILLTERRIMYRMDTLEKYGCQKGRNTSKSLKIAFTTSNAKTLKPKLRSESVKTPLQRLRKTKWEDVQDQRRKLIAARCEYYANTSLSIPSLSDLILDKRRFLKNILVDDKHKILYCYIPKVACSQWKKILLMLSGISEEKVNSLTARQLHGYSRMKALNVANFNIDEILERLKRYKKILIIRHPIERLLSAYNDKFNSSSYDSPSFKLFYATKIMRYARQTYRVPKDGEGLRFSEFLRFLSSYNVSLHQEHWRPYVHLCYPCTIDYDYIGKYESLETDSNFILESINATPEIMFPEFQPTKTARVLQKVLPTIPKDILYAVYRAFEPDFSLFGYEP